ncbi:transcriptional regulator [uncultured Desulfovibrio sp.]|uniref:transcriptional regulator n=1 Tax=uncultured Desulfovibrio sp. TaxID=167968 RepID=UPI00272B5BB0|nr:transcriptional regulator [uncultured Desulfovibrio sp.]
MGNEVNAAISAALPLIESLFSLGLPGIILMLAAIPALVIAVVLILDYRHGKRTEMLLEAYRNDTQEVLRAVSEKHEAILRDMSEKHDETAEFYRKNVTLVKNYEKMNDILQTLVVNNTRVMERLTVVIETRNRA